MWPSYNSPHWCSYRRVSGTTRNTDKLITWVDKCRCGKIVQVQATAGKIVKTWYDKDGTLQRITGDERGRGISQANVESENTQRIFDKVDLEPPLSPGT